MSDKSILFTTKGVKINGVHNIFIDYTSDIADISPKVIDILAEHQIDAWQGFIINKTLLEIRKELDVHVLCPVNTEGIKSLIRQEISKQPAIVWNKTKKILAGVGIILAVIIAILNILTLLKSLFLSHS